MNSQIVLHDSCLGGPPGCVVSESAVSNNGMTCVSSTISGDAAYIGWMCTNNQVYLASTCLNSSSGCSTTPVQVGSSSQVDQSMFLSDGGRFLAFQPKLLAEKCVKLTNSQRRRRTVAVAPKALENCWFWFHRFIGTVLPGFASVVLVDAVSFVRKTCPLIGCGEFYGCPRPSGPQWSRPIDSQHKPAACACSGDVNT